MTDWPVSRWLECETQVLELRLACEPFMGEVLQLWPSLVHDEAKIEATGYGQRFLFLGHEAVNVSLLI